MADFLLQVLPGLGYLGALIIGFISAATIFLPTPAFVAVFIMATPQFGFNPILLGIFAGIGSAIGELVGYYIGLGGANYFLKKYEKSFAYVKQKFHECGAPLIIFVFALTPAPFDIVGIFCGVIKYPLKTFFLATLAGKIIKFWVVAFAGSYAMGWLLKMLGG
jgi:membrane protein YqaA with SNARE-associated domain